MPREESEVEIKHALADFKKLIARARGRFGRDFIRRLPQGKLLDALDAGRECGFLTDCYKADADA